MVSKRDLQSLIDDPLFRRIEDHGRRPNVFQIVGMGSWEIKHSNFIAWLLDSKESHGLGDALVRRLVGCLSSQCAVAVERNRLLCLQEENLFDSIVIREKEDNIDLLFRTNDNRLVFCIENKTYSDASDTQLDKYHDVIESRYGDYDVRLFAFLTPDGRKVSQDKARSFEKWLPLSYEDIADCLRDLLPTVEDPKAQLLVSDYIDLLERLGIVPNEALDQELDQLYLDHKEVFDLVFERKKGIQGAIEGSLRKLYLEVLRDMRDEGLIQGCIGNDESGIYLWFTTEKMSAFLDTKSNGAGSWGYESGAYSYWIYPRPYGLLGPSIQFELGPLNQPTPTIDRMNELKDFFASGKKSIDDSQKYRKIWGEPTNIDERNTINVEDVDSEGTKQAVRNAIDRMLEKEHEFFAQR